MRRMIGVDRNDDGNIIVAVVVIMIITLLATASTYRAIGTLHSVRQEQDFSAALARADAGLSDALFQIDQTGTAPASSFCVGTPPTGATFACTGGSSVAGASDVQYDAKRVDDNTYLVTASGVSNHRAHAIQATVKRDALWPFALFGTGDLTFNGNGSGTITGTDSTGAQLPSRLADVGSAGTITCNSGASEGSQQVSYKNKWNGCPVQVPGTGTYTPLDPVTSANCPTPNKNIPLVPCAPSSALACPTGNTFTGVLSGTYLCTSAVTFTGTVTVVGGFHLYVIPAAGTTANVDLSGTTPCSVNWTSASNPINCGINVSACTANPAVGPCGDPTAFSIDIAGAGSLILGQGSNVPTITGTIYAPSIAVTKANGCQVDLTGALIVNTFTCDGGPNLQINYSNQLDSLLSQNWSVSHYTEIPSGQFVLAAS